LDHRSINLITLSIIDGCKNQSAHSQRQLYDKTVDRLYNVIYRIVPNHQITQDLLQEVYIKVFEKIGQFDSSKGEIYSWMCKIGINTSINHLRSKKLIFEDVALHVAVSSTEDSVLDKIKADDILKILEKLPEQLRVIFTLYEIEGYQHDEIAKMLHINVNSCRTYLYRAKMKLQELMIAHYGYYNSTSV
jgi:RNA polymerase sigma factor (sigma-70 family)